MSRLTDLIAQAKAKDPMMGADLEREFKALSSRRAFGLNFEKHRPESVELPHRPVRRGDKVHILSPRGDTTKGDQRIWTVKGFETVDGVKTAHLIERNKVEPEIKLVEVTDLVVVAEFRDKIYPGLVSTGKVENGGDKPFHSVINGENYHALKALTFTHRGKIDAIYIDPPYNTGAKDWKYNNDYVESEDLYRHSKWLAFMERRLKLARELLNPKNSVLIASIDEKEYLRLGLLLEQIFPEAKIQMVSTIIKPEGTNRTGEFSRTNEYVYFVMFGDARVKPHSDDMSGRTLNEDIKPIEWRNLRRRENTSVRAARPNQFYAVFVDKEKYNIHSVGDPIAPDVERSEVTVPENCFAIFPLKPDGTEMLWGVTPESLRNLVSSGFARVRNADKGVTKASVQYLASGTVKAIQDGKVVIEGKDYQGAVFGFFKESEVMPKTTWSKESHNAQTSGTLILSALLPNRRFPFPKSLYAVEDCLRFFVKDNKRAIVLDFFSGSGTTCHAMMLLNKQDNGERQCISITNNEVAVEEHKKLKNAKLRPGDSEWEKWGICEYITKPRISSAIRGITPLGDKIKGNYKYCEGYPMADGFAENAEFFTLTYETPIAINHNLAFSKIAPLLWIRAGSKGRRIESVHIDGWDVAETYGVILDLDKSLDFCSKVALSYEVTIAYIVTNDERRYQSVVRNLPKRVEAVRLYESYLNNFQFINGE
ncbi:site-specific DNA-methyltransferase [Shewanella algicola]|uniref:site-specific DNA-methyltransferase n=1 Tax=Shewanella algicola TaxID=640633 RepID=UPI002494D679|nr:DNA methyltransferase [Shewanella algicola]